MKVCDFISFLQSLDPDKNIWCIYDTYSLYELDLEVESGEHEHLFKNGLDYGDYVFIVG